VGAQVKINSGGSAGVGSGAKPELPMLVEQPEATPSPAGTSRSTESPALQVQAQKQALKNAARNAQPVCEICQTTETA
jgi:type VI secretion system secreted protein VgrG